MIVRHNFEISDDHPYTHNPKWRPNRATLDSAMLPITRVQIAVRNYYPRRRVTPGRRFAPWLGVICSILRSELITIRTHTQTNEHNTSTHIHKQTKMISYITSWRR
jgi:hypothetical protein